MERHERLDEWVNRRMQVAMVPSEWPDAAAGWTRVGNRIAQRPIRMWQWAGAVAALCVAVLALPAPRALAQRLWDQVVLGRIQVLVTDYESHGAAVSVFTPEPPHGFQIDRVSSLEDATRAAGFSPRLPAIIFPASAQYQVIHEIPATLKLRTPAMRYLLAQAGGSASDVPDSWNGVTLDIRLGPIVIADFEGTLLLQSRAARLTTPANFDLALFYRVAFQSMGMSEQDAWSLSSDMGFSPAMLMFMPKEDRHLLREFNTPRGTGMMIADVFGKGTIAALWSGSDRLYALYGKIDEDLVARVASALE